MAGREWTDDEQELLVQMRRDGASRRAIANKLRRSPEAVKQRLGRLGITVEKHWTPAEDEELLRLRRDGVTVRKIAQQLGRTYQSTKRRNGLLGGVHVGAKRPWTSSELATARRLRAEGRTCVQIAEVMPGRTWQSIKHALQEPVQTFTCSVCKQKRRRNWFALPPGVRAGRVRTLPPCRACRDVQDRWHQRELMPSLAALGNGAGNHQRKHRSGRCDCGLRFDLQPAPADAPRPWEGLPHEEKLEAIRVALAEGEYVAPSMADWSARLSDADVTGAILRDILHNARSEVAKRRMEKPRIGRRPTDYVSIRDMVELELLPPALIRALVPDLVEAR